jgi:hypothetical protein
LDHGDVPYFVLDGVIHHEMAHDFLGLKRCNGRRLYHHSKFKDMEAAYIHRDKADLWIKKNLSRLLSTQRQRLQD